MTAEDRVNAVAEFGFTPRQARFLVLVMRHAGVCLLRPRHRREDAAEHAAATVGAPAR